MRLFFDNNLSKKLARVLTELGYDSTHIAEAPGLLDRDSPDEVWLAEVSSWSSKPLVLTCDRDVERNRHIRAAFLKTPLVVFCFEAAFARLLPAVQAALLLWNLQEFLKWEQVQGPQVIVVRAVLGRAKLKFKAI